MARRRPTARGKSSNRTVRPTRRYLTEPLESRTYFVVLHANDVFEFWAESNHIERVVVMGNPGSTTVELIGTKIDNALGLIPNQIPTLSTMDGEIIQGPDRGIVGSGIPAEAFTGGGGAAAGSNTNAPTFYDDIYAIYVSKSDLSTRIAVAAAPNPIVGTPLAIANRPATPYTGSVSLLVNPTNGGTAITVSVANTGTALLGTRTFVATGAAGGTGGGTTNPTFINQPVYGQVSFPAGTFPTLPANQTSIGAGLTVQQANNLGEFMFGGTILGTVNIQGSIQLFYAGWIVTGQSSGQISPNPQVPNNFNVDGDIQSFLTNGSTGTNTDSGLPNLAQPSYYSGFDMRVAGKAGMVKSFDSFVGGLKVLNNPNAPGLTGVPFNSVDRPDPTGTVTSSFDSAVFGGDLLLNASTFTGAQFLGPIDNNGDVVVNAVNNTRPADIYAVPLIAGQTITVDLTGATGLGVYDGEERLIATQIGGPFQVTAKVPGVYYFAVNISGFIGSFGVNAISYTLSISNVGDLAIGGLAATNNILGLGAAISNLTAASTNFYAENGDWGAAYAGGLIMGGNATTFIVDEGNLRDVEGASLGNGTLPGASTASAGITTSSGPSFSNAPTGQIPNGTVGMLRAISTANASGQGGTGVLVWSAGTIGGDYQMVDAANVFEGNLVADGNIGTIRANSMATNTPSLFHVNAGNDPTRQGIIDLIDVTNDIGTFSSGGPSIITGAGGNVRYMHVGPNGSVFRDHLFGGGTPEATLYQPGETAVITDDSGADVSMTPQNIVDSLLVTTFPIEGSGGAAIVRVEVTNESNLPTSALLAGGVNIVTSGGGSAEIGSIVLDGTGTPVNAGTNTPVAPTPGGPPVPAAAGTGKFNLPPLPTPPSLAVPAAGQGPMDVTISGNAELDVYEITGITNTTDGSLLPGRGQVTSISDSTQGGEIVNVHLNSLGSLSASGSVGAAVKQNTAAVLTGNYIIHKTEDGASGAPYTYPLFEVSSMVRVLGNVISIGAGELGNVYTGIISNGGTPNDPVPPVNQLALPIPDGSQLQGSAGQVGSISGKIIGAVTTAGAINQVSANGIGWYGTGAYGPAGIFATGVIGPVNVNGNDSGAIITTVATSGVTINNGSLLEGVIANYSRFDFAEARRTVFVSISVISPFTLPTLNLGPITVNGNGGIFDSIIVAEHIGPIVVSPSGYGIFESTLQVAGDGTFSAINGGGYGIRGDTIRGGATTSSLVATGNGTSLPVTNFRKDVRNSETGATFDPISGQILTAVNDLDLYLGTSVSTPILSGSTESGVIENTSVAGSRDVANVSAWSIRSTVFNVANLVNQINVVGPVNGFTITTGRTGKYQFGGDVAGFNLLVAGNISNLVFNSSLLDSSSITAQGPSGRIGSILIRGNLAGTISAVKNIGKITIQGSMIGTIHGQTLGTLKLTGGLGSGSLEIDSNVGTIQTVGDLGVPGNTLTVNGSLGTLQVGGNLNTNVSISGNLKQLLVAGSILSATNVSVTNTIGLLKVTGDFQAGSIITAQLIKKKLIKGQLLGTITTA